MSRGLAVVSGSDSVYFPLLQGALRSVGDLRLDYDIAPFAFDAGMTGDQRKWLEGRGVEILRPHRPFAREVPGFVAMLASRPRLPELIPGYEAYLWIDADAWVQTDSGVSDYRDGALASGFCVTPESHPSYNERELAAAHRRIRGWFGPETVAALEGTAPINLGVFCGRADAPHWARWRDRVDAWLAAPTTPEADFNADQTAFNMVVYADKLETVRLPALYNWICHTAPPMATDDGRTLLEPVAPYRPLHVVHMTLWTKKGAMELKTRSGGRVTRPLTYRGETLPDGGAALPDFALKDLNA